MINNAKYKNNLLIKSVYFTTIFLFWSICFNSILAQTVITGKLLGIEGKPIPFANVEILYPGDITPFASAKVESNGNYKISTTNTGLLTVRFSGVNHNSKNVPILSQSSNINLKIDVQLFYLTLPDKPGKVYITGNFNNFNLEEMKPGIDGIYSFTIKTDKSGVKYKFYNAPIPEGNYEYDSKYGYLVVSKPKDGKLELSVDPSNLKVIAGNPIVKFEDENSEVAKYAYAILAIEDVFLQKSTARKEFLKTNRDGNSFTYDTSPLIKSIQEKIGKEADPILKQIYCFWQLDAARNYLPENKELMNSAIEQIIANVPANSVVVAYLYGYLIGIFDVYADDGSPAHRSYVDQFLQSDRAAVFAKSNLILQILGGAVYLGNEKVRQKYYTILMEKFSDTDAANLAKERYSKEIKISIGSPAPQFSLTSLDDPKVTYTLNSFMGKVFLIDFWAVWCGPCKAELPELSRIYDKYHSQGFDILSISFDRSPEDIAKYRAKEWKMPWNHVFLDGGFNNELAKDYEVSAIPKPVLIDGNTGKVLATTNELRGEQLEKTLKKFLK